MSAEKGGLRRADVSLSVCLLLYLSVAVLISYMGPFQLINQNEGRVGCEREEADQSERREGVEENSLTNQKAVRVCIETG